jgi:hypothetical protein
MAGELDWLFGGNNTVKQNQLQTPQQQNIINQSGKMGLQGLQNLNTSFEPIANQARQNFAQKTIPSIAERFTSAGGQRSSAFGQQLGGAGAELESNLASLGSQHNQQQQQLFQQLAALGLTPQFENYTEKGEQGFLPGLLGNFSQAIPHLAAAYASGGLSGIPSLLAMLQGNGGNQQEAPVDNNSFKQRSNLGSSYSKAPLLSSLRAQSGQGAMNQYGSANPSMNFQSNPGSMVNMLRMLSGQQ